MAYASISGRASTSARKTQAHAICDRCGGRLNHIDLLPQFEWRGAVLQDIRLLVCKRCLDVPQENGRAITLPADPTPIMNARVQDFDAASIDYRALSAPTVYDPVTGIPIPGTTLRVTQDCENRVRQPYGIPVGLNQNAVMPFNGATLTPYGVPLSILSVIGNGSATVVVTC